MDKITYLVGLGNPGAGYKNHRHNIGFRILDMIQTAGDFSAWREKNHMAVSEGKLNDIPLTLLKPMGYMNLSGRVLQSYQNKKNFSAKNSLVVHDEMALDFGRIKIKWGGGDAGHRGLQDISSIFGSDYGRLRFGVGHPGVKDLVHDHVVGNFDKAEEEELKLFLPIVVENFPLLIKGDKEKFLKAITDHKITKTT